MYTLRKVSREGPEGSKEDWKVPGKVRKVSHSDISDRVSHSDISGSPEGSHTPLVATVHIRELVHMSMDAATGQPCNEIM